MVRKLEVQATDQKPKQTLWSRLAKVKNKLPKGIFSKLAKAFMLPIALLPIAGILLGIGGTIVGHTSNSGALEFGNVLQTVGGIPFDNLAVLFAISVAIAYTEDAGVAGLTALVAYLVFNGFMAAFLKENLSYTYDYVISGVDATGASKELTITLKDQLSNQMPNMSDLNGWISNQGYGDYITGWTNLNLEAVNKVGTIDSYNLWFWNGHAAISPKLITPILGINTLNSGVFGGVAVGAIVAWLYNRLHKVQLPSVLSFFSGVRFVPIVAFFAVMGLSVIFILIWPGIGNGLNAFGKLSGKLPAGVDSLIEGLIVRSLIPFGLHHVFYAPLWWSGAGGSIIDFQGKILVNHALDVVSGNQSLIDQLKNLNSSLSGHDLLLQMKDLFANAGDMDDYTKISEWYSAVKPETWAAQGDQTAFIAIVNDGTLKIQDVWGAGLHLGRFQTGGFPIFIFGLPAMCLAMWMVVPKENRKKVMGIYMSAAFTSVLVGITEPVEFTLLFACPWMYYAIYVPLSGFSFMMMNFLQVKVCVTFSQGLLDFIIYGIIPATAGNKTLWWVMPIYGAVLAVAFFFIFYFLFRWNKTKVPGVDGATDTGLITKNDYKDSKTKGKSKAGDDEKIANIIQYLGGPENIETVDACATRLRCNLIDETKIDEAGLKSTGALGVIRRGKAVQVVYGPQVDVIKTKVKEKLGR